MKLEHVFNPIDINKTTFKNRMVVSAMVTNYCTEDGMPTEKFMAYHERKAKGGWGIIITEDFAIAPNVGGFKAIPGLYTEQHVEAYKCFTERIHKHNGKIVAQIYHAGRETSSAITGVKPVAPSAIKDPTMPEVPHALTKEEIIEIENFFALTALRAKKAGFDGIEIHGAHGYLVNQFVSPFSNKRTDEYGGSIYNRARFPLEIVKKIREVVGEEYPIFYRTSAVEYIENGLTIEDSKILSILLEEAGVDCIHVSQGVYSSKPGVIIPPAAVPLAYYVNNAEEIKKCVSIPVIAVGRINDPFIAESIIRSGKADLCTMARASLADPDMPNKAFDGRYDEILHCIGCVQGCKNGGGNKVRCLVNPLTGMEDEYKVEEATIKKKVVVVGGGIAGCETAIVAAKRGHEVLLLEKTTELGGQWIDASIPSTKSDFASFINWQKAMLKKYNVKIEYNVIADKKLIDSYEPDVVVLAVGSLPMEPPIEGLKDCSVHVSSVLRGKCTVGKTAAVIGGGLAGVETAEFIAQHYSKKVYVLEMGSDIVKDGESSPVYFLKKSLERNNVQVVTSAKVLKVDKNTVYYEKDGHEVVLEKIDTIVNATGVKADLSLDCSKDNAHYEVISVGDCNQKAKNGYLAIREGFEVGIRI